MVNFSFRGLITPSLTAFKNDRKKSLNLDVIPNFAKFFLNAGVKGVLVNGTTGEGMSLNVDERKLVAEEWLKTTKETKQHLMVQIGGAPLPNVLELAEHAEKIGASSLLCLPELYNKPTKIDDLIRYLKIVSEAAPKTPLLYYHIPGFTNVNMHMGQFLNAAPGKISTLCGIKFTSSNLDEAVAASKANNNGYVVFLGTNTLLIGTHVLGFDSCIASSLNVLPKLGTDIFNLAKENKVEEAQIIQNKLSSAINVITRNGAWVPTLKAAMKILTPIDMGPVREPSLALTENQVEQMRTELKQLKFLN